VRGVSGPVLAARTAAALALAPSSWHAGRGGAQCACSEAVSHGDLPCALQAPGAQSALSLGLGPPPNQLAVPNAIVSVPLASVFKT
jgi:hypothetical protein